MKRLIFLVVVACNAEPERVDPKPNDQKLHDDIQEQVNRTLARYRNVITDFLTATAAKDYGKAYDMLAASYRNMVPREHFVARIATNKNFETVHDVTVRRTRSSGGSTTAECFFGDLGRADIAFFETKGGPRISGITLNGTPALPSPP
jgi:hypothetical protein